MFDKLVKDKLQRSYSTHGVLVDSNILLILIVYLLGDGEIEKFKRTRNFITKDALGATTLINNFGWACTTPHIATEVSNLIDWFSGKKKLIALNALSKYVENLEEHHIETSLVIKSSGYLKLGVTDSSLVEIAQKNNLVLITADLPLYGFAQNMGVQAINFNNFREIWL